jgi:hypothetical protein
MDLTAIALDVDAQVFRPPTDRAVDARLYGITLDPDSGAPIPRLLEKGEARRILRRTRAPRGLDALALSVNGWRAPMEEDGTITHRPSQHPERQRVHSTVMVTGDGELLTILRTAGIDSDCDDTLEVLSGGEGVCNDLLRACWLRRRCSLRG